MALVKADFGKIEYDQRIAHAADLIGQFLAGLRHYVRAIYGIGYVIARRGRGGCASDFAVLLGIRH